jgi:hypothetical protein
LIDSYLKSHRGRLPIVYAVVDLTCLEKTGKYSDLQDFVRTYNGKLGVHVALLYLCLGPWRFPWSVRVYRGIDFVVCQQMLLAPARNHGRGGWVSTTEAERYSAMVWVDTQLA